MKKCPFCAEQIQDEAIVCRYCGRDLESKTQQGKQGVATPQTNSKPPIKKSKYTTLIVVIVFAVLLLCWRLMTLTGGGDNNKNDHSTMAVVQCEDFVRDSLKSPSTAKFPMITTAQNLGNNIFVVSSYVDAQNSFGAVIRNNYYCKIQFTRGDDADQSNWILMQLNLSE